MRLVPLRGIIRAGGTITKPTSKLLSINPITMGWFVLEIIQMMESERVLEVTEKANIHFGLTNRIEYDRYEMYLEDWQYQYLKSVPELRLFPKTDKYRNSGFKSSTLIIETAKDWIPPANIAARSITSTIFEIAGIAEDPESFAMKDLKIRTITESPRLELMSRFLSGFIQTGDQQLSFENGQQVGYRRLSHELGLTGSGQKILFTDTGVNIHSPFFSSENTKILNKDAIASFPLNFSAHGTGCLSIIIGNVMESSGVRMYRGVAYDGQAYVANLETDDGVHIVTPDPHTFSEYSDAGVTNNPWGTYDKSILSYLWDDYAFQDPDQLHVFAAGNSHSVAAPGGCKNVLSVGDAGRLKFVDAEVRSRKWILETDKQRLELELMSEEQAVAPDPIVYTRNSPETQMINTSHIGIMSSSDWVATSTIDPELTAIVVCGEFSYTKQQMTYSVPIFRTAESVMPVSSYSILFVPDSSEYEKPIPSHASDAGLIMKPDLVVPGEVAVVARSLEADQEIEADGSSVTESQSSVSSSVVAGLAMLVRQFFCDGLYPLVTGKSESFLPRSTLIRSMLINGATQPDGVSEVHDPRSGYGIPSGSRSLGLDGAGLRVIPEYNITSDTKVQYILRTTRNDADLSVTMSYLDASLENSEDPLYADLDLVVFCPSGQLYVGNNLPGNETCEMSTNERVVIRSEDVEIGEYIIEVHSSRLSPEIPSIMFSLSATGPFDQTDFTANPVPWTETESTQCPSGCGAHGTCNANGKCECDMKHMGVTCEREIDEYSTETLHRIILKRNRVTYGRVLLGSMKESDKIHDRYQMMVTSNYNGLIWHTKCVYGDSHPLRKLTDDDVTVQKGSFKLDIGFVTPEAVKDVYLYWAAFFTPQGPDDDTHEVDFMVTDVTNESLLTLSAGMLLLLAVIAGCIVFGVLVAAVTCRSKQAELVFEFNKELSLSQRKELLEKEGAEFL